jgi:hypothetical protein
MSAILSLVVAPLTLPPLSPSPPRYDADTALVLCRLSSFKEGLVLLYDKLRLHREVLQVGGGRGARKGGRHKSLAVPVM